MPVTVEVLTETRIGLAVNTFRKSSLDDEVICLAKEVLRDWKKLIPSHVARNSISSAGSDEKKKESITDDVMENSLAVSDVPQIPIVTTDVARKKCRDLLEHALFVCGSVQNTGLVPKLLAEELEDVIYRLLKNSTSSCKKCLQRKERREYSKRMAELRKQEEENAENAQNVGQQPILGDVQPEIHQPSANVMNLLQRLKQLNLSYKDTEDKESS
ncbi:transcription elongation factor A protein 1-like isoform X2 [Belonocnema kinseyi]|nr:transcription elongation factor A protein 1-like isoform X2 [Belonocnema kinseyi]